MNQATPLTAEVSDWHIDVLDPVGQSVAFPGQIKAGIKYAEYVTELSIEIREIQTKYPHREFFIATLGEERYRIQRMMEHKYAARRINPLPNFDKLKIPLPYQRLLGSARFNNTGGLIIFCGSTGSGKTSSAAATVEYRLNNHGGFCMTVEDPPEFVMRGFHGESGYCEQIDVTDTGFEHALSVSLRSFPAKTNSILFFGEIRNKSSAAELLRIAIDGHLVIATVHAKDIESCVQRLITLASSDGEKEARYLLASSLKLVVHQSLTDKGLVMEALEVDNVTSSIIGGTQGINLSDAIRRTQQKLQVM